MRIEPQTPAPPDASAGYERSDMSVRALVKFGIGFIGLIVVAHAVLLVMFASFRKNLPAPVTPLSPPAVRVDAPIVGPQLESEPSSNWEKMLDAQRRMLGVSPHRPEDAYGWVNPEAGVVRIPIERAMELALERGFPVRAPATQRAQAQGESGGR